MNKTFTVGALFATTTLQAQGAPFVDRACTRETEGAERQGIGFAIRPPFTKHRPVRALVVGMWRKPRTPTEPSVGQETGR